MDIVIVGAGGHGKIVLEILRLKGEHRVVGFVDADPTLEGQTVAGLPVLGSAGALGKLKGKVKGAIVAIGDNRTRSAYAQKLRLQGLSLVSAIHPAAIVSSAARLGNNIVIAAGATVCTDTQVGDLSIINTGAVVDHECMIGEAAHVCPGALLAGRVTLETGVFVGLGAKVIQCLSIGAWSTIGAGAVILRDVPAGVTVVGVPGRVIASASTPGQAAA